jgi:hypothetical protein
VIENGGYGLAGQISFSIFDFGFAIIDVVQRVVRIGLAIIEIATLSVGILAARCANYQDVFVGGNVYFTDADCYARMTRARMCEKTPGLIVRHHDFENFPRGTTPHTTAPLDYLILGLSMLLKPFTTHAFDLAGAVISPLLALLGGWFLWWWSRRMKFRYGWGMLILYAISPIFVHGTELGRPDHQSLLMLLVTIAICAEWVLQCDSGRAIEVNSRKLSEWSIVSGIAWGLAIWISAYESLVLFFITMVVSVLEDRKSIFANYRRIGWFCFAMLVATALLIEQRIPAISIFRSNEIFRNWARTIGELTHVSPANPVWFRWAGYMIAVAPILLWLSFRKRKDGAPSPRRASCGRALQVYVVLIATYFLTIWQARWAYFFVLIFAIVLPALLEPIKSRAAVSIAFMLSIFPVLRDWDARLWPNEGEFARRIEQRNESMQLRELVINLRSPETQPFLAPWWLSPAIAYWSGQPGVAGSSHESLEGIEQSARFFLSQDWQTARKILENRRVAWVIAYDFERLARNSSAILGLGVPQYPLCFVLDRTPAQAPRFLVFSAQNGAGKLYRTVER